MKDIMLCPTCGATREVVIIKGIKYLVCPACGMKSIFNNVTSEEDTLLFVANDYLVNANFEEARESYDRILARFPHSYAAHFGALLAEYNIQFVSDIIEGKKVPTIHNTSIHSLLNTSHLKKALEYAPVEIAENYKEIADKIEKIRIEWVAKAAKEPPFDIFLCFKDSDVENGIQRTDDSYAAAGIYTYLSKKGYNVFFSRESLRDKVAENYEPYIFNALNTAPIMIVYGSKPEYFASTWVKNEWGRYISKIKSGDKQFNSLVVAYDKIEPSELPVVFKNLQCMDASEKTFYEDLREHIEKVLSTVRKPVAALEQRDVKVGAIGKKAKLISAQKVEKASLGNIDVPQLTQDDNMKVAMGIKFCERQMFSNAEEIFNSILLTNPYNASALWWKTLASVKASNAEEFSSKAINLVSFDNIKLAITYEADKAEALACLETMSIAAKKLLKENISKGLELAEIVLGFKSVVADELLEYIRIKSVEKLKLGRSVKGRDFVDSVVDKKYNAFRNSCKLFECYLKFLDPKKVDDYISAHTERMQVAIDNGESQYSLEMANAIIEVDEGNVEVLWAVICGKVNTANVNGAEPNGAMLDRFNNFGGIYESGKVDTLSNIENFDDFATLEKLLSYCKTKEESDGYVTKLVTAAIDRIGKASATKICDLVDKFMSYYKSDKILINMLYKIGLKCLQLAFFDKAERYYAIIVTKDSSEYRAFWQLLLAKNRCKNNDEIVLTARPINENPEFASAMTAAFLEKNEEFVNACCDLAREQPIKIEEIRREEERKLREKIESQKQAIECKKDKTKLIVDRVLFALEIALMSVTIIMLFYTLGFRMPVYAKIIISVLIFVFAAAVAINGRYLFGNMRGRKILLGKNKKADVVLAASCKKRGMEKWKAIGAALMIACMLCCTISFIVVAVPREGDVIKKDGYMYVVESGEISLQKWLGKIDKVVTIPDQIDGRNVVKLRGELFETNKVIKEVVLPKTLKIIGQSTFVGCKAMTHVRIPREVTTIGDDAFSECSALQRVYFMGNNVSKIGKGAFQGCEKLDTISIPSKVRKIEQRTFFECSSLMNIEVGGTLLEEIGMEAFADCKSLRTVAKMQGLKTIGERAFHGCENIKNMIIPRSVTRILTDAFSVDVYAEATSLVNGWSSGMTSEDVYYFSVSEPSPYSRHKYWHYENNKPTAWNISGRYDD